MINKDIVFKDAAELQRMTQDIINKSKALVEALGCLSKYNIKRPHFTQEEFIEFCSANPKIWREAGKKYKIDQVTDEMISEIGQVYSMIQMGFANYAIKEITGEGVGSQIEQNIIKAQVKGAKHN